MKFTIEQKDFDEVLKKVTPAVSSQSTLPILEGILIERKDSNTLEFTATDLELGINHNIEVTNIEGVGNKIVLPANSLSKIVKELPAKPIDISYDKENRKVEIKTSGSKFSLNCYDAEEFPVVPEVDNNIQLSVSAKELKDSIDSVRFACAKSDTRPSLTGVLLTYSSGKLIIVATNTYRMAYQEIELSNNIDTDFKIILPADSLKEVSNLITTTGVEENEDINITIGDSHCKFDIGDTILTSRLIEGKFPNFKQVIPDDFVTEIVVKHSDFQQAIKRVALLSEIVQMDFSENNKAVLESADSDRGYAKEKLDIELTGKEQNINIDTNYILDVMKVIEEDEVKLEINGSLQPMVVRKNTEDNYTYLIMPIRPGSSG